MKSRCKYCQKEFTLLGLSTHETFCKQNPNRKKPWNDGLKLSDTQRAKISDSAKHKKINQEVEILRRKKISESCKGKTGGYRKGSGRGKSGWFNGIYCDSSWELAYLIWCFDNDIIVSRNTEKRFYSFEGKLRTYIPDFVVNDTLIEIKGYRTEQWEAKIRDNPDVIVLYERDIKQYLNYAISKHGKDFIKVYNG